MAGTKQGGLKTAKINKQKYGTDFYARIGAKGGASKDPRKGFGSNPDLARKVGAIGGRKSRRGKTSA